MRGKCEVPWCNNKAIVTHHSPEMRKLVPSRKRGISLCKLHHREVHAFETEYTFNCATCGRLPTIKRPIRYAFVKDAYWEVEWHFCSEECYETFLTKGLRTGKIKFEERVIFS